MAKLSFYLDFSCLQKQAATALAALEAHASQDEPLGLEVRSNYVNNLEETLDVYHDVLLALLKKDVTVEEVREFLSMHNNANAEYRNTYVRILPEKK